MEPRARPTRAATPAEESLSRRTTTPSIVPAHLPNRDITMYEAKEAGRNLVLLHPGLGPQAGVDAEALYG